VIRSDGWTSHCIWEHSTAVRALYRRRCRKEAEEMTAHAQAAELLAPIASAGDTILDAGCGSGYFYHSLASRKLHVDYFGVDAAPSLIRIGQEELPAFGLPAERLDVIRLEDLAGQVDHVVCINVLSNIDNYHRPLERLLGMAKKSLILRESLKNGAEYRWVKDRYLDPDVDLSVYVNHYDVDDVLSFISTRDFNVHQIVDRRSGGKPELVIDQPHYWTFIVAERIS
jgi:SAM-dependent methyltransferase